MQPNQITGLAVNLPAKHTVYKAHRFLLARPTWPNDKGWAGAGRTGSAESSKRAPVQKRLKLVNAAPV
jgi:hypothetical protein